MKRTELLAPAKDKETAFAAIDCGADAVYMGGADFGARKNAANSIEDIIEVVKYAHKFNVKIFITVNTILDDEEVPKAFDAIKEYERIGVDAVLIQDMGLLHKLIEYQPKIPVHASTQCDNRDNRKINFFSNVGLSRVVLARELSLEQIRKIHEENPNIELETFIHGALCVSYSGQCYLSQYIGGRSANRGECAQPCRKKYIVKDESGKIYKYDYPLCLKDFNASNHIKDLIESGVYSFKIEGRLKDINYVKNIVSYYRKELDKYSQKSSSGKSFYKFTPNPEKSFNRGFTDYFLGGKRSICFSPNTPKSKGEHIGKVIKINSNQIIVQTDKILAPQDGLCYFSDNGLEGLLVNSVIPSKNGTQIFIANKIPKIKPGTILYRNVDTEFEKILSQPIKRQIACTLTIKDYIELKDEDGYVVSAAFPSDEKADNPEKMKETLIKQFKKTGESDFYISDITIETEIPFLPISQLNQLRRELLNKLLQIRIKNYKRESQRKLNYSEYYEKKVDYHANVHNKYAEEFYNKCGAKVMEYSLENSVPKRQVELMRTKHCIKYALDMCKSPAILKLQDDKGTEYPLLFDCAKCEMAVLSSC